jgi:hypothetical protein
MVCNISIFKVRANIQGLKTVVNIDDPLKAV